jgi:hypothetical protein
MHSERRVALFRSGENEEVGPLWIAKNWNVGKPWSAMELFDLRNHIAQGCPIEETSDFVMRSEREVREKMEELGGSEEKGNDQLERGDGYFITPTRSLASLLTKRLSFAGVVHLGGHAIRCGHPRMHLGSQCTGMCRAKGHQAAGSRHRPARLVGDCRSGSPA